MPLLSWIYLTACWASALQVTTAKSRNYHIAHSQLIDKPTVQPSYSLCYPKPPPSSHGDPTTNRIVVVGRWESRCGWRPKRSLSQHRWWVSRRLHLSSVLVREKGCEKVPVLAARCAKWALVQSFGAPSLPVLSLVLGDCCSATIDSPTAPTNRRHKRSW